jgi:hypothetical protein
MREAPFTGEQIIAFWRVQEPRQSICAMSTPLLERPSDRLFIIGVTFGIGYPLAALTLGLLGSAKLDPGHCRGGSIVRH